MNPDFGYFSQNRIPENLVGETFKEVRQTTDTFNRTMMHEQRNATQNQSFTSNFPLTTNQDYHNEDVFEKAKRIDMSKKNYKKKTVYNAYVNAMFNAGVFTSPLMD